jgi:hypothetical protein
LKPLVVRRKWRWRRRRRQWWHQPRLAVLAFVVVFVLSVHVRMVAELCRWERD